MSGTKDFKRSIFGDISNALSQNRRLIHVIIGPRQVGKTTAANQVADQWDGPVVRASADLPVPPGPEWIETQWQRAKSKTSGNQKVLLVLDEVQKVHAWSEVLKSLWDTELREGCGINVIALGSSSLLLQKGLTESLAGRFFLYRCPHWGYPEMKQAFGWSLDQWIYYGGYPGAAALVDDTTIWKQYIRDSLIETVLSRDIFQMQQITKPALMRHLFGLSAAHPAEILSYNKMLGQLQDVGNTTTLAHYLRILDTAFLVSGLELFRCGRTAKRGSSPKLVLWNNALPSALWLSNYEAVRGDPSSWGRLVENAVGGHLLNLLSGLPYEIQYWRQGNFEVDFVVTTPQKVWGIEVKSGKPRHPRGLSEFAKCSKGASVMLIGQGGMELEEFFSIDPKDLFR